MHAARMSAAELTPNATTDEQAETEVRDEVDRASEADVAAGPHQPREAELEAEEEEKEDDAELGDELGDLGRADEIELAWLVRAEEEPARRYAGIADRPNRRATSPSGQDRDGERELAERHAAILPGQRRGAPIQEASVVERGGNRSSTHS